MTRDPTQRPSASDLLRHEWIQKHYCSSEITPANGTDTIKGTSRPVHLHGVGKRSGGNAFADEGEDAYSPALEDPDFSGNNVKPSLAGTQLDPHDEGFEDDRNKNRLGEEKFINAMDMIRLQDDGRSGTSESCPQDDIASGGRSASGSTASVQTPREIVQVSTNMSSSASSSSSFSESDESAEAKKGEGNVPKIRRVQEQHSGRGAWIRKFSLNKAMASARRKPPPPR